MGSLESLHQHLILDHYRNPRNKKLLENHDLEGRATNPMCGDEVTLQLCLKDEIIDTVGLGGKGCSISQAAASIFSTRLSGHTLKQASNLANQFTNMMRAPTQEPDRALLGDLLAFEGVQKFPLKVRCVLLVCEAFDNATKEGDT